MLSALGESFEEPGKKVGGGRGGKGADPNQ